MGKSLGSIVGESDRDRYMDELVKQILHPVRKPSPWEGYQKPKTSMRIEGNSKYVAMRSESTDTGLGGYMEKVFGGCRQMPLQDASLRVLTPGGTAIPTGMTPRRTLLENKLESMKDGLVFMPGLHGTLEHFHRFNTSTNLGLIKMRGLSKTPTVQLEYILAKKPEPQHAEGVAPAVDLVNAFASALLRKRNFGRPLKDLNSSRPASQSSSNPQSPRANMDPRRQASGWQSPVAGEFHRTPSGSTFGRRPSACSSPMNLLHRTASSFGRSPVGANRSKGSYHPALPCQGREFLKALMSRPRHLPSERSKILDKVGLKKSDINAFCDSITGASELVFIQKCQELLTYMPDERSFNDLNTLLDLLTRLPFLYPCTAVERFAIVRTSRLQKYKAGQTVLVSHNGDGTRLLVVLSGTVVEQNFDTNTARSLAVLDPLDPQDALLKLCAHIKNLSSMGQESLSWPNATPRIHRNLRHDFQKLPSIQSRPNTILNTKCLSPDHLTLLTGGRFVAKTDTNFLEVVVEDFDACVSQYTIVDKEQQGNDGYVATFLASLDLFHSWSWTEGSRVEGIHIILRGEAQMEFDSTIDRPERDVNHESSRGAAVGGGAGHLAAQVPYGFSVDKTANEDGQPVTRVTKKHQTKSIGLTICGDRSVFGEALGLQVQHTHTHTAAEPQLRHRFGIRMLSPSEVFFIPSHFLEAFFTGASRKRMENKKEFFTKLSDLYMRQTSWLHEMAGRQNMTLQELSYIRQKNASPGHKAKM